MRKPDTVLAGYDSPARQVAEGEGELIRGDVILEHAGYEFLPYRYDGVKVRVCMKLDALIEPMLATTWKGSSYYRVTVRFAHVNRRYRSWTTAMAGVIAEAKRQKMIR